MFSFDCPECGRELGVGDTVCPGCGARIVEDSELERPAPRPKPRPATRPPAVTARADVPDPVAPSSRIAESQQGQRARPEPPPFSVQPKHLALVGLLLLASVLAALYVSRPGLFSAGAGLALEDVEDAPALLPATGSVSYGDLQIAGIRTWYTDNHEPRVKAVIINHGEAPRSGIVFEVSLSPLESPPSAPPLARFTIRIDDELGALASREIEADLLAMGTLASMPAWNKIRILLEAQ